ncbi:MAG: nucleotide pyrophosphohydrolase [Desulfatibacillaceae bacterium]|nr:nucleotide pyrophosphohydrolase [Desulfatibacillaceae bacterium]
MDIKILQEKVVNFARQRAWEPFHNPKDLALCLSIEAAELLEHFLWKDKEQVARLAGDEHFLHEAARELGDVFICALNLTAALGLDPAGIIEDKLKENNAKYPADKAFGRADKYGAYLKESKDQK